MSKENEERPQDEGLDTKQAQIPTEKDEKDLKATSETLDDVQGKGVGDVVEKITKKTGVKKIVKKFTKATGVDCNCDKRKERWNEIRIFRKLNPECLEKEEEAYLRKFFKTYKSTISVEDQKKMLPIYNRVLRRKQEMTSCAPCWENIIKTMQSILSHY